MMTPRSFRPPCATRLHPVLIPLFLSFSLFFLQTSALNEHATVTAPPTAEQLRAAEEASDASVKRSHEEHVASGREPAYIITLRGKDFGNDDSHVSIRINGINAADIMLHNTTAVSFLIPTSLVLDREAFRSSFVEISIGSLKHRKFPLFLLEDAISKVDLIEYREKIARLRRQRLLGEAPEEDVSNEQTPHVLTDESPHKNDMDDKQTHDSVEHEDLSEWDDRHDIHGGEDDVELHDGEKPTESISDDEGEELEKPVDPIAERDAMVSKAEKLLAERKTRSTEEAVRILTDAIADGDPRAMTIYGASLLSGTAPGMHSDVETAVFLLKKASDMGYPDAQALLGFLYASGIAGTSLRKDIGAAILMWTFAAEGGSMYAKMALGYRYFSGTDIPEDCEQASIYYQSVAEEVVSDVKESLDRQTGKTRKAKGADGDSMAEIGPPTSNAMLASDRKYLSEGMTQRVMGEANEIVQYYRHAADRGDAAAQVTMGNLYYYGAMDMPQDIDRARQLFRQAANVGRAEAHANLGFMDLRAGRNESAVYHLKRAADRGDKLGLHGMGFVTLHGIGVKKNAELAASYFGKASEKEHPEASFNLAIMHSKGIGVPHSADLALRYYLLAASRGHIQSTYQVGMMYLEGTGSADRDCTLATQHLKLVAQKGVWNKILSKAFRSYERSSYADALYYYLLSAHAGIELAQYNAAFMFEHNKLSNSDGFDLKSWGLGVSSSKHFYTDRRAAVEEAFELYQMSASQGHRDSLVRMGDLAFGEAKDFARAASAYERAVKLRSAEAMFNLGWMHARGFGMNPDKFMAKRYFDMAMDADRDAYLPATIAVYSLKYSQSLASCLDRLNDFWSSAKWLPRAFESEGEDANPLFAMDVVISDTLILSVLLGLLVLIVILRRIRMATRNRTRGENQLQENYQGTRATPGRSANVGAPETRQGDDGQPRTHQHEHQD